MHMIAADVISNPLPPNSLHPISLTFFGLQIITTLQLDRFPAISALRAQFLVRNNTPIQSIYSQTTPTMLRFPRDRVLTHARPRCPSRARSDDDMAPLSPSKRLRNDMYLASSVSSALASDRYTGDGNLGTTPRPLAIPHRISAVADTDSRTPGSSCSGLRSPTKIQRKTVNHLHKT